VEPVLGGGVSYFFERMGWFSILKKEITLFLCWLAFFESFE